MKYFTKIRNFPNYVIFRDGSIYSLRKRKFMAHCFNDEGYAKIKLSVNGKITQYYIHRIVAIHFIKKPKGKDYVNHIDRNRTNAHVSNLEWCTHQENIEYRDKVKDSIGINDEYAVFYDDKIEKAPF